MLMFAKNCIQGNRRQRDRDRTGKDLLFRCLLKVFEEGDREFLEP